MTTDLTNIKPGNNTNESVKTRVMWSTVQSNRSPHVGFQDLSELRNATHLQSLFTEQDHLPGAVPRTSQSSAYLIPTISLPCHPYTYLERRKTRLREVKEHVPGHTAGGQRCHMWNPGWCDSGGTHRRHSCSGTRGSQTAMSASWAFWEIRNSTPLNSPIYSCPTMNPILYWWRSSTFVHNTKQNQHLENVNLLVTELLFRGA